MYMYLYHFHAGMHPGFLINGGAHAPRKMFWGNKKSKINQSLIPISTPHDEDFRGCVVDF